MGKFKSIITIILGNLLLAVSVTYFVLPYDILSGGVAGISLITEAMFGWDTTIVIDVLVIVLFIFGFLFLGKEFALKTLLSSIVYPVFITILDFFPYTIEADKFLIALFGAVIGGVGIGIVIKEDASTGGMDIPPLIIHKYTGIPISTLMTIVDAITVLAGFVSYGFEDLMYGLVYIYLANYVLDKIIVPNSNAVELQIISTQTAAICDYIQTSLERGTTILKGRGGYTDEDKDVIMTVVYNKQYNSLIQKINELDPYAFVIVEDAKDIKGEGFSYEYRV